MSSAVPSARLIIAEGSNPVIANEGHDDNDDSIIVDEGDHLVIDESDPIIPDFPNSLSDEDSDPIGNYSSDDMVIDDDNPRKSISPTSSSPVVMEVKDETASNHLPLSSLSMKSLSELEEKRRIQRRRIKVAMLLQDRRRTQVALELADSALQKVESLIRMMKSDAVIEEKQK